MSRKKQQTYGEMARLMAEMQKKMEAEKGRMAEVMASALLDDKAAALLGDFSDADLRRVMVLLAGHVEQCAAQVNAEKQARKEAQKPQERPRTPTEADRQRQQATARRAALLAELEQRTAAIDANARKQQQEQQDGWGGKYG